MKNSISRIRIAVRYVRQSPSRWKKFKKCVAIEKIESKSYVCLDVRTRWNSTYLMLDAAVKFESAFDRLEGTKRSFGSERWLMCQRIYLTELMRETRDIPMSYWREYNTFFPTLEDELMGMEFLLAEPNCNDGLVEPFLGVSSANLPKCFVTKDRQDLKKINNGIKTSDPTWRQEDQHQEVNYGQVQGTDEGILQEMNNLPSIYEDYLFDLKFVGELPMLDFDSSKRLLINHTSELVSVGGKQCDASGGNYCDAATDMVDKSMNTCRNPATESDHDPEDHSKAIVKISEVNTNTELSLAPSQDERSDDNDLGEVTSDKSGRKRNRYWSDYEITILIEGVAKYGVGRWTDIKRGLFPPTTRRTSVDLKDKWRNLLKTCTAQLHSKNEGRRVAHQQVPQAVLGQVKELAAIHPYPKNHSPKNALVVRC